MSFTTATIAPFVKERLALAANGNYSLPADSLLLHISIKPTNAANISIGTTPAGTEILNAEAIGAGEDQAFSIGLKVIAATTLYITGITSNTDFIFYRAI